MAEHFLARVHFHRWQAAGHDGWTAQRLMAFHKTQDLPRGPNGGCKAEAWRTIAAGFDAGLPASEVALRYMIEAQEHLNVLPRRGRFAHAMERALSRMDLSLSSPRREEASAPFMRTGRGTFHAWLRSSFGSLAGTMERFHRGLVLSNPVPMTQGSLRGCDHASV